MPEQAVGVADDVGQRSEIDYRRLEADGGKVAADVRAELGDLRVRQEIARGVVAAVLVVRQDAPERVLERLRAMRPEIPTAVPFAAAVVENELGVGLVVTKMVDVEAAAELAAGRDGWLL